MLSDFAAADVSAIIRREGGSGDDRSGLYPLSFSSSYQVRKKTRPTRAREASVYGAAGSSVSTCGAASLDVQIPACIHFGFLSLCESKKALWALSFCLSERERRCVDCNERRLARRRGAVRVMAGPRDSFAVSYTPRPKRRFRAFSSLFPSLYICSLSYASCVLSFQHRQTEREERVMTACEFWRRLYLRCFCTEVSEYVHSVLNS